jgi:hypothetical protein
MIPGILRFFMLPTDMVSSSSLFLFVFESCTHTVQIGINYAMQKRKLRGDGSPNEMKNVGRYCWHNNNNNNKETKVNLYTMSCEGISVVSNRLGLKCYFLNS